MYFATKHFRLLFHKKIFDEYMTGKHKQNLYDGDYLLLHKKTMK